MRADRSLRRLSLRVLWPAILLGVLGLSLLGTAIASAQSATAWNARPRPDGPKPTIVLVHGAWADASSWDGVTRRLLRDGYAVLAPANPLRGLATDAAYLGSVLDTIPGPIVLVGHSYGGVAITNAATGRANVKALVYVAGFAPEAGEDVATMSSRFPGSQLVPPGLPGATLIARPSPAVPGASGIDTYIDLAKFRQIFAADLPEAVTSALAVAQRPADAAILQQKSGVPAWKTIPSWAVVATKDNTIGTQNVRFMANRAGAHVVEVNASHAVTISEPEKVADVIRTAVRASA